MQRVRWFGRQFSMPVAAAGDAADARSTTRLLILQPTPFCNVRCSYCYLPDRDDRRRMRPDTAAAAVRAMRNDGLLDKTLTVVWHAGEPLAVPPSFYDEAIAAIADAGGRECVVEHSIQTNGVLIDDAWCAVFKKHGIRVGLSIDGPASLHDACRVTRHGRGTHARVMRGVDRLRAHGIAFHVIAVVTDRTLRDVDAFIAFFEALGATELGCNVDEVEGMHARSSVGGHEPAYRAFLERLMQRAGREGSTLQVRELEQATRRIGLPLPSYLYAGRQWPDNAQVRPWALVVVAHDGAFTTFSPELLGQRSARHGDFVLGNVYDGSIVAAESGPAFQRLWADIRAGVAACERSCKYFAFCGGGAPANKFYECGTFGAAQTLYCRTTVQQPFDIALELLEGRRASSAATATHAS